MTVYSDELEQANQAQRDLLKTRLDRVVPANTQYPAHAVAKGSVVGTTTTAGITPFDSNAVIAAKVAGATEASARAAAVARMYPPPALRDAIAVAAKQLLSQAVLWLDADAYDTATPQILKNKGTGGSALNARLGSTVNADTNDPQYLSFDGTPSIQTVGGAGNYLSTTIAAAKTVTSSISLVMCEEGYSGTTYEAAALYGVASVSTPSFGLFLHPASAPILQAGALSSATMNATIGSGPLPTHRWTRTTLINSVSGGAARVTVEHSNDPFDTTPAAITWTLHGTYTHGSALTSWTLPASSSLQYSVGATASFRFRRSILTIDGTTVSDIDAAYVGSAAATSFPARTGETVTIARATSGRKTAVVTSPEFLFAADDFMSVPDNALINFDATESFTAIAAVRQWGTPLSSGRYLSKTTGGVGGYFIGTNGTALNVLAGFQQPATTVYSGISNNFVAGVTLVATATLNRANQTGSAGYNSVVTPASTSTVGTTVNAAPLTINNTGSAFQDFEWRAAAIFRRALTQAEISLINAYYQQEMP